MAEDRARRRREPRLGPEEKRSEDDGERRFQRVEDQRRRREALAPGAQNVGRADIARADRPQVAGAEEARQNDAERDRAEQIAESQRERRPVLQSRPSRSTILFLQDYSWATRPATRVSFTRPSSRAASKGVLRQRECRSAGSST